MSASSPAFLQDHRLIDTPIFPGAAYAEMALAAARQQLGSRPVRIETIKFERALMLRDEQRCHIQTVVHRGAKDSFSFEIVRHHTSQRGDAEDTWQMHSTGSFAALNPADTPSERIDLARLMRRIATRDSLEFYKAESVKYGPSFRGIKNLWTQGNEILARIELPPHLLAAPESYRFHPVLLDSCFQAIGAVISRLPNAALALPVGLVDLDLFSDVPPSFWVHVTVGSCPGALDATGVSDIAMSMFDDSGLPIARIARFERKALTPDLLPAATPATDILHELAWTEQSLPDSREPTPRGSSVLLLTDDTEAATELAGGFARAGTRKIAVHDYLGAGEVGSVIRRAACDAAAQAANLEILFMRVGERDAEAARLCELLLLAVHTIIKDIEGPPASIAIITKGSQSVYGSAVERLTQVSGACLWGVGAAISKEHPDLRCLRIDLDPEAPVNSTAVFRELARPGDEELVAYRGVTRYVARLRKLPVREPNTDPYPFKVAIAEFGTFDSLRRRSHERRPPDTGEVEVEIHAAGLNFKESLIVLGMLDTGHDIASDVPVGLEGAGRIARVGTAVRDLAVGDAVIVWANGCLGSHVTTDRRNVIEFDARKLTYERAASLPTAFMTAYYALRVVAQIKEGDRVLIHAAAGGVGQAAVQIARAAGAQIYATASRSKWDHLSNQGINRIFDSRDLSFSAGVMQATEGQGVDIVLNSLAGEFIEKGFNVLATGGTFIEIGKQNIWSAERARNHRPDVSYHVFELGVGAATTRSPLKAWLRPSLEAAYSGAFSALPVRVFSLEELVPAFRWLAAGRNIGKGVIRVRDRCRTWVPSSIGPSKHYLVSGGLGALGLHVAHWLVQNGARQITLLGRHPPTHEAGEQLQRLRASGATIAIRNCDVSDREQMAGVLAGLPNVTGVFHCAGLLDDGTLANLTSERFQKVLRPKVSGVQVLHELTLGMPLDHFVCFSSTSASIDGAGQANYAAANAYLDSFVLYRRTLGLAGLTVNWGGWAGSGLAADFAMRKPNMAFDFITKEEGLAALQYLIQDGRASAVVSRMRGKLEKRSALRPMFKELVEIVPEPDTHRPGLELPGAADPAVAVARTLRLEVARVLGMKQEELRDDDDFIEMGIDSLMLAELRNNVQSVLGGKIRATAFFAHPNIAALAQHIAQERIGESPRPAMSRPPKAPAGIVELSGNRSRERLFCISGHGENIFDFRHLAESVKGFSVCVLHAGDSYSSMSFEPNEIAFLAKRHVAAMTSVPDTGPYQIVGHSFGGSLAVEVAIQLLELGRPVGRLVLLDSHPTFWYRDDPRYRHLALWSFFASLFESLGIGEDFADPFYSRAKGLPADRAIMHLRQSISAVSRLNLKDIDRIIDSFTRRLDIDYRPNVKALADIRVTHVEATKAPYSFAARVAMEAAATLDRSTGAYGWKEIFAQAPAQFRSVQLDCSHKGILSPPFIDDIARILALS